MYTDKRRYRVVNGKVEKTFSEDGDGWFKTKAEAWEDVKAAEALKERAMVAVMAPKKRGRPRKSA